MVIGEHRNKLRDRVIWIHVRQKIRLVNPSKRNLVACQLHPYGIHRISRHHTDVSYHQRIILINIERICNQLTYYLLWLLLVKTDRICANHEIEILSIMMLCQE